MLLLTNLLSQSFDMAVSAKDWLESCQEFITRKETDLSYMGCATIFNLL